MNEGKKDRRDPIRTVKPRNFVAKNAVATTSGAGAHKDKKKAMKQGEVKHKKKEYAEHLNVMLKTAITENLQSVNWIEKVRGEVESGRDLDDALEDLRYELENKYGADENTVANILAKVEINLSDLRYGDDADEGFDGEYDDEAGMADNNLETMKRAVQGIDNLIDSGDNLPEWCQEKIAVAKSMLVAVWDYMESEEQSVSEARANTAGVRAGLAKRNKAPLSAEEQRAKDKAKSDKWLEKERAKQKAKANEGWTHDSLAAQLFETENTYEDRLANLLNKKLGK